jgi:hypothetical protein
MKKILRSINVILKYNSVGEYVDLCLILIIIVTSVIRVYLSVDISLINSSDLLTTSDESKIPLILINKTYLSKLMNVIRFKK